MRYSLCALLLAAMPLVPVRVERAIDDSLRCSIRVVPGYRVRADAVLLATASADTVLTGPGHIVPSVFGGHSGAGAPGPIFGQMFEAARFSSADSARLATAFKTRGDMRIVIVPWDYDPACDPTRWTGGFAWVPAAKAGTFTVALRPDSLWTDGIPVFDAFIAAWEPYPYPQPPREPPSFRTAEALSAEQYFELLTAMPTGEDQRERPDSAWRAFLRWRDANPALVGRYPVNQLSIELARSLSSIRARRVLRSIEPVIAGTFRMTIEVDGGAGRSFYVRTRG